MGMRNAIVRLAITLAVVVYAFPPWTATRGWSGTAGSRYFEEIDLGHAPLFIPPKLPAAYESRFVAGAGADDHTRTLWADRPWTIHPDWAAVFTRLAALGLATFVSLRIARHVADRHAAACESRRRCPVCDYDLRATRERCPECGTPVGQI